MLQQLVKLARITLVATLMLTVPAVIAPAPEASASSKVTIAVFGDYGYCYYTCQNEQAVADLVHGWSPDYIVTVGDNTYESGRDFELEAAQRPYVADVKAGRFYQITGNHDWGNTCNPSMIAPSTNFFGRPPHYTAHLAGGLVDLFALDMNCGDPDGDSANSVQAQQYRADVAASTATWKLTADHQAFYSSGKWGTQTYTHWAVLPQIDLFLSGHDHDMEHLVVDHQNFLVTGAGGKNHDRVCVTTCVPGSVWHNDTTFGATRLTVTPTTLQVEFVALGGKVLYSFTMNKGDAAAPTPPAPVAGQAHLPLRAAFYYPWFPEAWTQRAIHPYSNYEPSLGYYDSSSPAVVKQQIAAMQYGQIQAGIASWWGQGSKTDSRIKGLLAAAAGTGFTWTLYYEPEGQGDPSPAAIASDLAYIRARYASDPSYLHIDGRFVLFVYSDTNDGCATTDRWSQARAAGVYVVMRVFPGYRKCSSQPDGWHQYAPANPTSEVTGQSFAISPGFSKAGDSPRLGRDLNRWEADIQSMVSSHDPWQLVTTFNEWGEGTAVEGSRSWPGGGSYGDYLQALHDNGKAQDDMEPSTVVTQVAALARTLKQPLVIGAGLLVLLSLLALMARRLRLRARRRRGPRTDLPPPALAQEWMPVAGPTVETEPEPVGGGGR
ncbi:MAG: metallophosphoesterase [Chloroflexota bacterium]